MIPILLTLGLLFGALGAAQWLAEADYPFSARNMLWCAIALPALGALLLLLAVLNMIAVARALANAKN